MPRDRALTWNQRWDTSAGTPGPASVRRAEGSTVYFGRIGTFTDLVLRIAGDGPSGALATCEACFATAPGPWLAAPAVPDLSIAREHPNAVALPDGSVFVVGGNDGATPILTPELFRWGTGQWIQQPAHVSPRDYHGTAVLLPDASVLVGGANNRTLDYEVYLPPYLTGTPPPVRPSGLSIFNPSSTDADGTFVLLRPNGAAVPGFDVGSTSAPGGDESLDFHLAKVVLISPGSTTHHSDMHQRYFECVVTTVAPNLLQFTAPSELQAPNGYYLLFVLSSAGIPSNALWVRLRT
jgi:hypothetical protein